MSKKTYKKIINNGKYICRVYTYTILHRDRGVLHKNQKGKKNVNIILHNPKLCSYVIRYMYFNT